MKSTPRSYMLMLLCAVCAVLVGCGGQGPDDAMRALAQGMADNKPQSVWEALPASYQADVQKVLADFAGRMDPEIWNKGFAVAQQTAEVLKSKKEFILANPMMQSHLTQNPQIAERWDDAADALGALVNSEVSDLEKLGSLDVGAFLARTGAPVMQKVRPMLAAIPGANPGVSLDDMAKAEIAVVASEGDTATVRTTIPGQSPVEEKMVRVEGKWIPKVLADTWPGHIAQAQKQIAAIMPADFEQSRSQIMMKIGMAEGVVQELAGAKTQQEFNMALMKSIGMAMAGGMPTMPGPPPGPGK